MRRSSRAVALAAAASAFLLALPQESAAAQLRPLEPPPWQLVQNENILALSAGSSYLRGQRASLAGVTGNLIEAGNFSLGWRTGRVILEAAGTVQRFFDETSRFAPPYPDVSATADGKRHDSGDYRLSTTVRVTPDAWPAAGVVRFGTRLPATDNTTGLDRDAIDFFATVGALSQTGRTTVAGDVGLGIHSTREQRFEQDDLLLYSLLVSRRIGPVVTSSTVLGQKHGSGHSAIRGVEDLGEIRIGLQAGTLRWVRIELTKGYETFSPASGIIVTAGLLK